MLDKSILDKLKSIPGINKFYSEPGDCWTYGYDNSRRHVLPDAVIFPENHQQVVAIVQICNEFNVPITTRGRGTATTGATVPVEAGVPSQEQLMKKFN